MAIVSISQYFAESPDGQACLDLIFDRFGRPKQLQSDYPADKTTRLQFNMPGFGPNEEVEILFRSHPDGSIAMGEPASKDTIRWSDVCCLK